MRLLLIAALAGGIAAPAAAQAPPTQGWSPGHYEDGRWIAGLARGRYDEAGRWIAGEPAGRVAENGVWLADPAPGYWDAEGRWRAGAVMGEYDEQGRWRTLAPGFDREAAGRTGPADGAGMAQPRPRR